MADNYVFITGAFAPFPGTYLRWPQAGDDGGGPFSGLFLQADLVIRASAASPVPYMAIVSDTDVFSVGYSISPYGWVVYESSFTDPALFAPDSSNVCPGQQETFFAVRIKMFVDGSGGRAAIYALDGLDGAETVIADESFVGPYVSGSDVRHVRVGYLAQNLDAIAEGLMQVRSVKVGTSWDSSSLVDYNASVETGVGTPVWQTVFTDSGEVSGSPRIFSAVGLGDEHYGDWTTYECGSPVTTGVFLDKIRFQAIGTVAPDPSPPVN